MLLEEAYTRFGKEMPDERLVDQLLEAEQRQNRRKFVVLDDDPTGIQTVHDVSVYTDWSVESIKQGFMENNSLFYLLTNSRATTVNQTTKLHLELTSNVVNAANETGKEFMIISRSDSTLRGHYPLETELVKQVIENRTRTVIDGEILFPFFKEGGRYTIDNIHYVEENGNLIPAGETEFAKDKTFGYRSSNLCDYIEEKTNGEYLAEDTIAISIESLRRLEIDRITSMLCSAGDFTKIIVNAMDYIDVKVFCIALFRAMALGRNFMIRCAASFVKVLGGITSKPLLTRKELIQNDHGTGGIIVIGSYTNKTTMQLDQLRDIDRITFMEFNTDCVLDPTALDNEINRVSNQAEEDIKHGRSVVIYTKRAVLTMDGDTKEDMLLRSVKISEAVCEIVSRLKVTPNFIIAKGGITSSDIGVKALRVKRAKVLGQVSPGIPVWKTDAGSRFPDIPYIIFPGNVGKVNTLADVVRMLLELES
jgi:uncharacterized protein YgbK (DUF1537 family)